MTSKTAVTSGLSLAGKSFFGSLCVGTFALGVWQTRRLVEKLELQEQQQADLAMPPASGVQYLLGTTNTHESDHGASSVGENAKSNQSSHRHYHHPYRRVVLKGTWQHEKEFLVGPRGAPLGLLGSSGSTTVMAPQQQGYYVWTPLRLVHSGMISTAEDGDGDTNHAPNSELPSTVLINRGWIPRQMVANDPRRRQQHQQQQQHHGMPQSPIASYRGDGVPNGPLSSASLNQRMYGGDSIKSVQNWSRPSDVVEVMVLPCNPEKPRFLVAEHQLRGPSPPQLFWLDRPVMHAVAGLPLEPTVPLVTAISRSDDRSQLQQHLQQQVTSSMLSTWPIQPTAEQVVTFKVSPAVHAGYALTWYGLSAAGIYMTRKLVLRKP